MLGLFPAAIALHNAEEAYPRPVWVRAHADEPRPRPSAVAIRSGLMALTIRGACEQHAMPAQRPDSAAAYLVFRISSTMRVNVALPHVPVSLA